MSAKLAATTASARWSRRRPTPDLRSAMADVTRKIVIALDGMGGDMAPEMVVRGAGLARERHPDITFRLFGPATRLADLVKRVAWLKDCCEIVPADDVVTNDDTP